MNGWAVGEYGTVLKLSGGTWSLQPSITNQPLKSLALASGAGWIVGSSGTVLQLGMGAWSQCTYSSAPLYAVATQGTATWAVGPQAHRRELH
jgi:hypothetical protein